MTAESKQDQGSALLRVRDLRVRYGATEALAGLDLDLQPGERVALVGGSGSGKTSAARALVGLLPLGALQAREILFDGKDLLLPHALRSVRGRGIGYAFQDALATLDPLQTIGGALREAVCLHRPLRGAALHATCQNLMHMVELHDAHLLKAWPHQLSGGQRQRVGLALALAGQPRLLIADEPTSALDPTLARTLARLLVQLSTPRPALGGAIPWDSGQNPLTILLISHDMRLVQAVCERAVVLHEGHMVEAGPVAQLLAQPQHPATRTLLAHAGLAGAGHATEAP